MQPKEHDIAKVLQEVYSVADNMSRHIISCLDIEELKSLYEIVQGEEDSKFTSFVKDVIDYLEHAPQKKSKDIRNQSVSVLIKWFKEGKGKKREAYSQMKHRFMHLNYTDQIKVMSLLINESVAYRKWCYKTLLLWEDHTFDDKLIELWNAYHETACAWTIINLLPDEKLRTVAQNMQDFFEAQLKGNTYAPPSIYFKLYWRLTDLKDVSINWDYLRTHIRTKFFLKLANKAGHKETEQVCRTFLYDTLKKKIDDLSINKRICLTDELGYPGYLLCHDDDIRELLCDIYKMGHHNLVLSFYQWDMQNRADFVQLLLDNNVRMFDPKNINSFMVFTAERFPANFDNLEEFDAHRYKLIRDFMNEF